MGLLLDTSVLIMLRDADTPFDAVLAALDDIPAMSLISRVELEGGVVAKPELRAGRRAALDALLSTFPVIDFDDACVAAYRSIVEKIGFSRARTLDRMIAATALVHDFAVVTTNERDFRDVPDLRLEPWSAT
ncbi:MAG: PIN domain-containing protein [Pseudomonadota bacterium]